MSGDSDDSYCLIDATGPPKADGPPYAMGVPPLERSRAGGQEAQRTACSG
ncbi:hypothetical protein [Streptomyces sp. NPDC002088]